MRRADTTRLHSVVCLTALGSIFVSTFLAERLHRLVEYANMIVARALLPAGDVRELEAMFLNQRGPVDGWPVRACTCGASTRMHVWDKRTREFRGRCPGCNAVVAWEPPPDFPVRGT